MPLGHVRDWLMVLSAAGPGHPIYGILHWGNFDRVFRSPVTRWTARRMMQRLTALVALVAPWALLMLTALTNPQANAAYGTITGQWIVVAGGTATGVGFALAGRASRLAGMPRVFA